MKKALLVLMGIMLILSFSLVAVQAKDDAAGYGKGKAAEAAGYGKDKAAEAPGYGKDKGDNNDEEKMGEVKGEEGKSKASEKASDKGKGEKKGQPFK